MDVIINNATPGAVQMVPQQYVPTPGVTYAAPYGYGPGYRHEGGFPGFFLVLLIIGAVVFLRRRGAWRRWTGAGGPGGPAGGNLGDDVRDTFRRGRARFLNDHALDIARERYAKGEINADEYETLRRTLSGEEGGAPRPPAGGDEGTLKL
ncbi:SHOCT domain-containing protein [Deinococcus apachensis]|uniref:SHOCT domain-containing protein n=1 Tax=Deinococcus apachensis TaxID=309886 RepID=UPI0003623622|nr:SHOCT domain-containing protein [Deinococcus apachensis]